MKPHLLTTLLLASTSAACVSTIGPTGDGRDDRDTGDCPLEPYGLVISTASDLRDIPRGCFSLDGDLVIERSALSNLDALKDLRDVRGSLRIEDNSSLTSLTGLTDVRVSGDLVIENNPRLVDLTGLDGTDQLTALTLRSNDALKDLSGLRNLDQVGGDLLVSDNGALTSLAGLDRLRTIDGDLVIEVNDRLTSLTGLGKVDTASTVTLERNAALASVAGLSALTTTSRLLVTGNTGLRSLTGLALTHVRGDVDLESNGLTQLGALPNLGAIDGNLIISANPGLAGIDGLSTSLVVAGSLRVTNNTQLSSVYALYLGARATSLIITGNPSLSRSRAEHLATASAHQAAFPARTITGNSTSQSPDVEPHG